MRNIENSQNYKIFLGFLLAHFVLWSLLPLWRHCLPMDSLEAIIWGKLSFLATPKHPPLSGIIAYPFFKIFHGADISIYILSQIFIVLGFLYIYLLGQKILKSEKKAFLASILLEGTIYYGYSSPEYNVNVISIFLWPALSYYFYQAIYEKNSYKNWFIVGLFVSFDILDKYVSGALILGMVLFLLATPNGRKSLKTVKPYFGAIIAFLIILPHFYFLYQHDFYSLKYFLTRTEETPSSSFFFNHFFYSARFIMAQILFSLGSIIAFCSILNFSQKNETNIPHDFLFYLGIFPILFICFLSLLFGITLRDMWGFPTLYMLGILFLSRFEIKNNAHSLGLKFAWTYLFLGLISYFCFINFSDSLRVEINPRQFAQDMEHIWYQKTSQKLKYVSAKDNWFSDMTSIYGQDQATSIINMDLTINPWIDPHDFCQKGTLIIANSRKIYREMTKNYPNAKIIKTYKIHLQKREVPIIVGILLPGRC